MLKKLAGQTALYGLSSMLGRAINFLLVPFYTSPEVMAVGSYGVVTELYAYVAFLNVVYLFGMETTYFRYANKEELKEQHVFNVIQTFLTLLTFVLSFIFIVLAQPFAVLLGYADHSSYVVWLALVMGIDAITAIPFARLRQEKKAGLFAFAKLLNIGINIGLNLFFLVFCKGVMAGKFMQGAVPLVSAIYEPSHDVEYIFISNMIANACMLPLLWKHFLTFRIRFDNMLLKPMIRYAWPIMIMGLAGMVNEMLSRILLKPLLPDNFYPGLTKEEVLGIFGGCYKLSMFMTLSVQAFRYAADPFFFSKASDKNAPQLFARVMNWFVAACGMMLLVISIYADVIGRLFLRQEVYQSGLAVVPVLLLANLFLGTYYYLSVWYKLTDKTYWGTWIGIGGALFTIISNVALIPVFGYMGAAYTTLLCYFLMSLVSYLTGEKYFPVPYDLVSVTLLIGGAVLLIVISSTLTTGNFWLDQSVRLIYPLAYLALIYSLRKTRFS